MSQVSNTTFATTVSSNAMAVVDYLSKSMMSALPFIACAALFRTVAVIMGEGMLPMVCRFRNLSPVLQLAL